MSDPNQAQAASLSNLPEALGIQPEAFRVKYLNDAAFHALAVFCAKALVESDAESSRFQAALDRSDHEITQLRDALRQTDALMWEWSGAEGQDDDDDDKWRPTSVRGQRVRNIALLDGRLT